MPFLPTNQQRQCTGSTFHMQQNYNSINNNMQQLTRRLSVDKSTDHSLTGMTGWLDESCIVSS